MHPILYAMNIGTLAAWLSVSGASTVAYFVKESARLPVELEADPDVMTDGPVFDMDLFSAGSAPMAQLDTEENSESGFEEAAPVREEAEEWIETLEIPVLPELAETEPLPEIPDLPKPKPAADTMPKPAVRATPQRNPTPNQGNASGGARRSVTGAGSGQGSGASTGAGSGELGAARFAGGRRPRPPYPAAARKQNVEGSVVVFITVDENGNVVNAAIRSASHPSLHDPAILNTLRRWKFRPGPRGSITQTIRFQLQ